MNTPSIVDILPDYGVGDEPTAEVWLDQAERLMEEVSGRLRPEDPKLSLCLAATYSIARARRALATESAAR
jgi:hypothetical protein